MPVNIGLLLSSSANNDTTLNPNSRRVQHHEGLHSPIRFTPLVCRNFACLPLTLLLAINAYKPEWCHIIDACTEGTSICHDIVK